MTEPSTSHLTNPPWSNKKTLHAQLQRLWDRGLILQQVIDKTELFPKRLIFKTPGSKDLSQQFETVRKWIQSIKKLNGLRIIFKPVQHRIIGENQLPVEAWVDSTDNAVQLLNKQREWQQFKRLVEHTKQHEPQLLDWIAKHSIKALSLADEWSKFLQFISWRKQHPNPGIYLRQVCLKGIDSKFIEQHRPVLLELLNTTLPPDQIQSNYKGARHFEARFGFLSKPPRVRFRLLDPNLPTAFNTSLNNDMDYTLTAADFASLNLSDHLQRIFITENEINFLSFPAQVKSLIIFGSGYGFDALASAQWLKQVEIIYWGDIDTHGFAILDQLRSKFPHVKSLLMDLQTLIDHKTFWGTENKPESKNLNRLNSNEQTVYQALQTDKYQSKLRLEQERIGFDYLQRNLQQL
ncbi:MAG: Wadjet anti-phage system protein JetD domain-containing protein [bacterium]